MWVPSMLGKRRKKGRAELILQACFYSLALSRGGIGKRPLSEALCREALRARKYDWDRSPYIRVATVGTVYLHTVDLCLAVRGADKLHMPGDRGSNHARSFFSYELTLIHLCGRKCQVCTYLSRSFGAHKSCMTLNMFVRTSALVPQSRS